MTASRAGQAIGTKPAVQERTGARRERAAAAAAVSCAVTQRSDRSARSSVLAWRRRALPEAVLETPRNVLQVAHTARSSRTTTLRLHAPVELAHLRRRVAAGRARLLLDVVRALPAARAQHVRLAVMHTLRRCTLRHGCNSTPSCTP